MVVYCRRCKLSKRRLLWWRDLNLSARLRLTDTGQLAEARVEIAGIGRIKKRRLHSDRGVGHARHPDGSTGRDRRACEHQSALQPRRKAASRTGFNRANYFVHYSGSQCATRRKLHGRPRRLPMAHKQHPHRNNRSRTIDDMGTSKRRVAGALSFRRDNRDQYNPFAAESALVSRSGTDGFSLLEMVATIALTSLIVLVLSLIAGQWLPNWRHGFADLQQADLVGLGFERLLGDISVAQYVTPWGGAPGPLFEGDPFSVVFVRTAIGPNARPQLEIVRIAATSDERGPALVRSRAPFAPTMQGGRAQPIEFTDPVTVIRAPYKVTFAYADPTLAWAQDWRNQERLPEAIRLTVADGSGQRQPLSIVMRLKHTARATPDR